MQSSKGKIPRKKAPREDDVTVAVAGPSRQRHVSFPFEVLISLLHLLHRSATDTSCRSRITTTHINSMNKPTLRSIDGHL